MLRGRKQRILYSAQIQNKEVGHIMSKEENKLLRQLMAEHNLTKEEVLARYDFRKQLSATQKPKRNEKGYLKFVKRIRKSITKELKLPREHPLVIDRVNDIIKHNCYKYKGEI